MKLLKAGLRVWITIASVVSFISGWILLVHAPKPNQSASLYDATTPKSQPTLAPLPPLSNFGGGDDDSQNQFSFNNVQPRVRAQSNPFFTTGGS